MSSRRPTLFLNSAVLLLTAYCLLSPNHRVVTSLFSIIKPQINYLAVFINHLAPMPPLEPIICRKQGGGVVVTLYSLPCAFITISSTPLAASAW